MKKLQKSIRAIVVVVTMGVAFSLTSSDAMSQVATAIYQTERDMEELNRMNQQFIETSVWHANNGIVLDNVSITTDDRSSCQGKLNPSQYESAYRSYEKSAQSYYNTLTSGGVRSQDSKGNISERTVGQMEGESYTTAIQGLKNAQEDMKRIRREVGKYGVHIQQSKWETATAGY